MKAAQPQTHICLGSSTEFATAAWGELNVILGPCTKQRGDRLRYSSTFNFRNTLAICLYSGTQDADSMVNSSQVRWIVMPLPCCDSGAISLVRQITPKNVCFRSILTQNSWTCNKPDSTVTSSVCAHCTATCSLVTRRQFHAPPKYFVYLSLYCT